MDDRGPRPWQPSRKGVALVHDWVVVNVAMWYAALWERHQWLTAMVPHRQIQFRYTRMQRLAALLTSLLVPAAMLAFVVSRDQRPLSSSDAWWCVVAAGVMLVLDLLWQGLFEVVEGMESATASQKFWERLRWKTSTVGVVGAGGCVCLVCWSVCERVPALPRARADKC